MPNDNTHTGIDDVLRVLNSRNANGEIEYGAYSELHDMISALSRTPAEPKAGDWEEWAEEEILAMSNRISVAHEETGEGEAGNYVYSEDVMHIVSGAVSRALSSAAPRITEDQFREQVEHALEGGVIDDPEAIRSTVDRIMSSLPVPLSGITEEMVERIEDALHQIDQWAKAYPEDIFPRPDLKEANRLLTEGGVSFSALNAYSMNHVIQRVKGIIDGSGIRDLLRQQGPQRSEDQQGAEREWISVDELRHVEARLLVLELLRRQGYAKGGYFNTCKSCGKEAWWMDKLAWTCLECAQHNVKDLLYSITNDPSEPPPFTPTQTEE